jgi:hypothetical protein
MRLQFPAIASLFIALALPVSAQSISEAQMRAANVARMQAEELNGGLGKYSPAKCMRQGGGGNCMVSETSRGFLFRFLGRPPGWDVKEKPATLETVVLVSLDGNTSTVEYNGQVRKRLLP